jgi:hypothetical protein
MISVPSAMQFMPERWRESLTPKSKTPHSLTVVMLTHSLRRVTWRHVLSLKDFTYSIIIERTPLRYHNMMKPHTVKYQWNSLGGRKGMVVGQQKLKWLEFQYNSNTKMKLRKELWWKTRATPTTEIWTQKSVVRPCGSRPMSDTSNFVSLLVNFGSYRKRDTDRTE